MWPREDSRPGLAPDAPASRRPRVLVAPDKFKGTLTAVEAADAIADAVLAWRGNAEVQRLPIADGGDGTVAALGGANRVSAVTGADGRAVEAAWRLDGMTAVVESSAASGLVVAGGAERNDPWAATSAGTGELIALALRAGATRVLVGMGGVATTDGGRGALSALEGFLPLEPGRVVVLTDTTTAFEDAARVFGPQKGAGPELVAALSQRLDADADEWRHRFGVEVRGVPRTGAAGGLAGALFAAGATLADGAAVVAERLGLVEAIATADLVITGEGAFDATSAAGKGPGHVVAEAARRGVPAIVVAGAADASLPEEIGFVVSMTEVVGRERATSAPAASLTATTGVALARVARGL